MARYYERISDEDLLATELEIDDPDAVDGLVTEVPEGDAETFVEFSYDQTKTGRAEMFTCVHGHHQHLKGFVMRKGDARFRVGWICAQELYDVETFAKYKSEFKAAVQRRKGLLQRREVEDALSAIVRFVDNDIGGEALREFERVCREIDRLPSAFRTRAQEYGLTPGLISYCFEPVACELRKKSHELRQSTGLSGEQILQRLKSWFRDIVPKMEGLIDRLDTAVAFFQPPVLEAACRYANENDVKPRTYEATIMTVTCHRVGSTKIEITLAPTYRPPDRKRFNALVEAFNALGTGEAWREAA